MRNFNKLSIAVITVLLSLFALTVGAFAQGAPICDDSGESVSYWYTVSCTSSQLTDHYCDQSALDNDFYNAYPECFGNQPPEYCSNSNFGPDQFCWCLQFRCDGNPSLEYFNCQDAGYGYTCPGQPNY